MSLGVDSAKPLLDEVVSTLKRVEEILSLLGIFYIGKLTLPTLWDILRGIRTHAWSKVMGRNLLQEYGKWAVVTDSTGGIGKAYAFELARNGMSIVLVARNIEQLEEVAREINKQYGVETVVVEADICKGRTAYKNIFTSISSKDVGILVNNVETARNLAFLNATEDDLWDSINTNIGAAPAMTKIVLPGMVQRKRGAIVNISSIGAYVPLPLRHLCSASEAFVDSYSRSLEYECRGSGVILQSVLPFQVAADSNSSVRGMKFRPYLFRPSPASFAYHAVGTLGYSSRTSGYWAHGVLAWLLQKIPEVVLIWSYALINQQMFYKMGKKS